MSAIVRDGLTIHYAQERAPPSCCYKAGIPERVTSRSHTPGHAAPIQCASEINKLLEELLSRGKC